LHRVNLARDPKELLNVVPDFMSDYVGLGKISRSIESLAEFLVEREVDVDPLVTRAIKRAGGRGAKPASRLHLARKKNQSRLSVPSPVFSKDLLPNIFRLGQNDRYELPQFLFLLI
jgi:hypothetical protein